MTGLFVDRLGFPYLPLPAGGGVGLLPVTRSQVEYAYGDPAGGVQGWYAEALAVAPRASFRDPAAGLGAFVGGLTATEVAGFAGWLHPAARLPTPDEWRQADRLAAAAADPEAVRRLATSPRLHPAAAALLARPGATWRAVGRFAGGLYEWVRTPAGQVGFYGRPAPDPLRLVSDPQTGRPHQLLDPARHPVFGCRLFHPTPPGADA